MKKLLCLLGFYKWEGIPGSWDFNSQSYGKRCKKCGKIIVVI